MLRLSGDADKAREWLGPLSANASVPENAYVLAALDLISHANNNCRITLHSPTPSCRITGDAHRIKQVVLNLLTNAIRYSPGSDRIEVYLVPETDQVKIGVKDHGIGIAPEKLNHIFSRYYRVDDNSKVSGLGIGLYLCYEIVTRHQGRIWAESELGAGSTFWFSLPYSL